MSTDFLLLSLSPLLIPWAVYLLVWPIIVHGHIRATRLNVRHYGDRLVHLGEEHARLLAAILNEPRNNPEGETDE